MRSRNLRKKGFSLLALVLIVGCQDALPRPAESPSVVVPALATRFHADACGDIEGRVIWHGPIPEVPAFKVVTNGIDSRKHLLGLTPANPNTPRINAEGKSIQDAVVFLRGVEPALSRPWNHPAVRVEQQDLRLKVMQGEQLVRTGFVRQGEEISTTSSDPVFHMLQARGAAFFSCPFVERDQETRRRLDRPGLVELGSGAGYYWMNAYLFVDYHPYYVCTDADGRFRIDQVPPGRYQLACWHPNWQVLRRDRDPETGLISRITFAPPLEQSAKVEVTPGRSTRVDFTLPLPDKTPPTK